MLLNFKAVGATCVMLVAALAALTSPALAQPVAAAGEQVAPPAPPSPGAPPPQVTPPQAPPPQITPPDAQAPGEPPAAPLHQAVARPAWTTTNVNLRGGPGTDSEIIATIPAGSTVHITSRSGEWCAVTWNGQSGYAIARNLASGARRRLTQYRPQPYYAGEAPVVYGPPVYYPPPVVYGPGIYYGPRFYYGRGWGRRW